jgi:membrane-bound lytic murein transglycosylase A
MGVPLTTERSLAIDRSVVPLGSLLWLDTVHPVSGQAWQRAMVGQDTGGAIVGRIRADVFWGFGAEAARAAGTMKTPGRMWVMEPR